ncbi:MAG: hypothetical protein GTN70_00890 [Deltaproteobacteria bacterium]|nr:hypothetical protein [Deltaproteobacteria bacterium]
MGSMENSTALSPQFFILLRYCMVLVLLIHLPYVGMAIAGSALSVLLNFIGRERQDPGYRRLARELIETVTVSGKVMLLLGLLPIFPLALIIGQILPGPLSLPWLFWAFLCLVLLSGFTFLFFYRATFNFKLDRPLVSAGAGSLGHVTLLFALVLIIFATGILFNPESLPFIQNSPSTIISWRSVVRLILTSLIFTGLTGGALLLFIARKSADENAEAPVDRELAGKVGRIVTLAATLPVAPFVIFDLITLPDVALSTGVFAIAAAILLLSLAVCIVLLRPAGLPGEGAGASVFVLYLAIFLCALAIDGTALGNAYFDRSAVLEMKMAQVKEQREALREEAAVEETESVEAGEAVFERLCSGCHRFDARVVGPPLLEVLPKYAGDAEKLKSFIRNPVKVDPDYPPMPKLSIEENEIESVVAYLLGRTGR